jgi:hypothetical protein
MNSKIVVCAMIFAAAAALGAQQASQSDPYQGVSTPPSNDEIVVTVEPEAKPPAGHPLAPAAVQKQTEPQAASADPQIDNLNTGTDDGIVHVAPRPAAVAPARQVLAERANASDPDGDIVHPRALAPGELGEGTTIRVRLLQRLSTASSQKGETFRSQVASDVMQNGQVLIPAGTEIDGQLVEVSSGHVGGHGTMRLRPLRVIMPDGTHYQLQAEVSDTPGSKTSVGAEGTIKPDSRARRDGIEYGGAVGAGATTGAILGGPAGALAGGLIGAGVITAHLLINHPQAVLESGTAILFTRSAPLNLVPVSRSGI